MLMPKRSVPLLAASPAFPSQSAAMGAYTACDRPGSFLCEPLVCRCSVAGSNSVLHKDRGLTHQKSNFRPLEEQPEYRSLGREPTFSPLGVEQTSGRGSFGQQSPPTLSVLVPPPPPPPAPRNSPTSPVLLGSAAPLPVPLLRSAPVRMAEKMTACIPARIDGHAPATAKSGWPEIDGRAWSETVGARLDAMASKRRASQR
mmetsp:Transcript_7905/g.25926  ORF Transcript_7905/g.25926 Transcript_7905/m.25926 type:complete len:201 (+) Transcript_7905:1053-1655(+)